MKYVISVIICEIDTNRWSEYMNMFNLIDKLNKSSIEKSYSSIDEFW